MLEEFRRQGLFLNWTGLESWVRVWKLAVFLLFRWQRFVFLRPINKEMRHTYPSMKKGKQSWTFIKTQQQCGAYSSWPSLWFQSLFFLWERSAKRGQMQRNIHSTRSITFIKRIKVKSKWTRRLVSKFKFNLELMNRLIILDEWT